MFLCRISTFREIRERGGICVNAFTERTLTTEWPSERILQAIEWAMTDKYEPAKPA